MKKSELKVMVNKYAEEAVFLDDMRLTCCCVKNIEAQKEILRGMSKLMFALGYQVLKKDGKWCLRDYNTLDFIVEAD